VLAKNSNAGEKFKLKPKNQLLAKNSNLGQKFIKDPNF